MSKILNLDKLIPEDRFFELAGKRFRVPGALSVEEVLKTSKYAQEVQTDPNKLKEALTAIWDILAPYNPTRKKEEFVDQIKLPMIADLLEFIFNDKGGEEEETQTFDNSKNASGR